MIRRIFCSHKRKIRKVFFDPKPKIINYKPIPLPEEEVKAKQKPKENIKISQEQEKNMNARED